MTTNTLVRANRVSVQADELTGFVAKFHRTHKLVATVRSVETGYLETPGMNKTANRELFRVWVCEHAESYGIQWDPTDRRTETNTLPAKYPNEAVLCSASKILLTPDIDGWLTKINGDLPESPKFQLVSIECDEVVPVTQYKGRDVAPRYNNGNWAYATVRILTTIRLGDPEDGNTTEGYVSMDCTLVSGQLKKPSSIGGLGYTYTGFRTDLGKDFPELVTKPESTTPTTPVTITQEQAPTETPVQDEAQTTTEQTPTEVEPEVKPEGDTPDETATPTTGRVGRKLGSK